jgi:hypothetical protein
VFWNEKYFENQPLLHSETLKKKKERESLAGFWRKKSARQFLIVLMFYILQMQKRHAWFLLMDHVLTFLKKWEFGIYLVGKD